MQKAVSSNHTLVVWERSSFVVKHTMAALCFCQAFGRHALTHQGQTSHELLTVFGGEGPNTDHHTQSGYSNWLQLIHSDSDFICSSAR